MYGKMIPIHKEANLMGIYKESTPLVPVRDKILVNKQEASALIALGESTIERLMKQDAIPYLKIGGRVLFSVEQLVNWVALKGNSDDTRSSSCDLKMQGGQNEKQYMDREAVEELQTTGMANIKQ